MQEKKQQRLAESLERIFNPRQIKDPRDESFWDMIHINLCPNLKFFSFSIFFSIFLILIFILQLIFSGIRVQGKFLEPQHISFTEWMLLEKSFIVAFREYYRIFTATFAHRDMPCLSNSIILLLVWGSTMEYSFMIPRTIITFVITSMMGNAFGLFFSKPLEEVFMGADAGIFGLLGAGLGYIIFNWNRIKSKTSSKLSMFFMVTFIVSISMIFAPSFTIVMIQLGGCLSGIFVGMMTSPLIGAKSGIQFEEYGLYENAVFLVGALVSLLTSFFLFTLLSYQTIQFNYYQNQLLKCYYYYTQIIIYYFTTQIFMYLLILFFIHFLYCFIQYKFSTFIKIIFIFFYKFINVITYLSRMHYLPQTIRSYNKKQIL